MAKTADAETVKKHQAVDRLDLRPIAKALVEDEVFTRAEALVVEREYRRFLQLHVHYPNKPIVPTDEVDKFWHAHIYHTEKYATDCAQALGAFLHHDPGLKQGTPKHAAGVQNRDTFYEQVFGEPPIRIRECTDTSDPDCG